MPELVLTRALAVQTMGELEYEVPGGTVRDALTSVFERQPTLRRHDRKTLPLRLAISSNDLRRRLVLGTA